MSKKLLEEQAVRKFMKIAGLQPLANNFLKESEEVQEEGYGKKKDKMEESADSDGETLEEVEDLEESKNEAKEELEEERSGFVSERADDERASERVVGESKGKGLSPAKPSKMKGDSHKMKPAKKPKGGSGLMKEEDMPEGDMDDAQAPAGGDEETGTPEADPATEAAVKKLLGVITTALAQETGVQISMEDEGGGEGGEVDLEVEPEAEMGGEEDGTEGGDEALDEAGLEKVVAETVRRVKARLNESVSKPKKGLTREQLAKKVVQRVAEKLKKH